MFVLGQANVGGRGGGRQTVEGKTPRDRPSETGEVKNQRDRDEESEVRVDPSLSHLQASMLGWGLVIAQATVS